MISELEQIKVEQYLQRVKQRELLAKEKKKQYERNRYSKDKLNGGGKRNSEEAKARKKELSECECGAKISRGWVSNHEKSIKHQNFVNLPEDKPVTDNLITFREYINQNKITVKNNLDQLYEEYWNIEKKKKITCECGEIISRAWLPQHKRTTKHQAFMISLVE